MDSIFQYRDFRLFLREHYRAKKAKTTSYSFRFFSQKAGLSSPNYYKLVMDGDRNLTHRNIRKFCVGLGLNEKEALFFENLVLFNQAKDASEQQFYEKNMREIIANQQRGLLSKEQYEVLAKWYPLAIKELIHIQSEDLNAKDLAQRLNFRVSPEDVKAALNLLLKLGLIETNKSGKGYRVTQKNLETPDVTYSDAAAQYHQQVLDLAKEALKEQNAEERCFSSLIVAVNTEDLPKAFRRLHAFRNELDLLFGQNQKCNALYQFNLQLFRLDHDAS